MNVTLTGPKSEIKSFFQIQKSFVKVFLRLYRHSEAIVRSDEFTNLGKPILIEFLKRDGLNINEEALFQAVLRYTSTQPVVLYITSRFDVAHEQSLI